MAEVTAVRKEVLGLRKGTSARPGFDPQEPPILALPRPWRDPRDGGHFLCLPLATPWAIK